jgi:hypothetical protein
MASFISYIPAILEILAAIVSIVITVVGYVKSGYRVSSRSKILRILYDFDNYANIINSKSGRGATLWVVSYILGFIIFFISPFLFHSPDEISSIMLLYMFGAPGYGFLIVLVVVILRKRIDLKSLFLLSGSYLSVSVFIFLGFAMSLYLNILENIGIRTTVMTILYQILFTSVVTTILIAFTLVVSTSLSVSFEDEFFRKSNERVYLKVTTKQTDVTGRVVGIGDTLNIQNGDGISLLSWRDVVDITILSEKRTIQRLGKHRIQ